MSSQCKSFILSALENNATQRPSISNLLNHPWIQKYALSHHLVSKRTTQAEAAAPIPTQQRHKAVSDQCDLSTATSRSFISLDDSSASGPSGGRKIVAFTSEIQNSLSAAPSSSPSTYTSPFSKSFTAGSSSSSIRPCALPLLPARSNPPPKTSSSHLTPISINSIDKSPAPPTQLGYAAQSFSFHWRPI